MRKIYSVVVQHEDWPEIASFFNTLEEAENEYERLTTFYSETVEGYVALSIKEWDVQ